MNNTKKRLFSTTAVLLMSVSTFGGVATGLANELEDNTDEVESVTEGDKQELGEVVEEEVVEEEVKEVKEEEVVGEEVVEEEVVGEEVKEEDLGDSAVMTVTEEQVDENDYGKMEIGNYRISITIVNEVGQELERELMQSGEVGEVEIRVDQLVSKDYKLVSGNVNIINDNRFSIEVKKDEILNYNIVVHDKGYKGEVIKNSKVYVRYQDENGKDIHEADVLEGAVGQVWRTRPKDIPGYKLLEIRDGYESGSGNFKKEDQEVVYIYERTNEQLPEPEPVPPVEEDKDEETPKPVPPVEDGDGEGNVSPEAEELTVDVVYRGYKYKKGGHTEGREPEEVINLGAERITGLEGETFTVTPPSFEDRNYVLRKGNELEGVFKKGFGIFEVDYLYVWGDDEPDAEKPDVGKGEVVVKYLDVKGNEISESKVISGDVGEEWELEELDIEGYQLKDVEGSENGFFMERSQEVIYYYGEVQDAGVIKPVEDMVEVTVNIVQNVYAEDDKLQEGKVVDTKVIDTKVLKGFEGDEYELELEELEGLNLVNYEVGEAVKGVFGEEDETIEVVYEPKVVIEAEKIDPDAVIKEDEVVEEEVVVEEEDVVEDVVEDEVEEDETFKQTGMQVLWGSVLAGAAMIAGGLGIRKKEDK